MDSLLLPALISKSKSAENPTEFLLSKLSERALLTYNKTEKNDQKHQRGIALLQVCATESDVDVLETEEVAPQSAAINDQDSSLVVDELLPIVKSENVFGRDAEKKLLLSQLLHTDQRAPQLAVIPVVGMAGVGKTTLARLVYEDGTVKDHFELKAWVKMDGHEQNQLFDIARKLLKSATGMSCSLNNMVELYEMVVDTLLSHRSLIVLDGLESMEMELWQHLKETWFRFVGLGSKIVITTRDYQVAEIVAGKPFYLGELSPADSWSLYSSLAFSRENAGRIPAAWCKGAPLSLRLLGSLTRFEETLVDLMEGITDFLFDRYLVLCISLLALPQHLFNCFAYCGIFPCGYVMEKEKLIKMWIAHGVVVVVKPSLQSLEDVGEAYFHELLCRSFFTDITCNEYGEIVQARMPNFVHEFAQRIAEVVYKDKIGYAFDVDANSLHLSLALPFQQVYNPINLQTLLSFPHKNLHLTIPNQSFVELKRLRSLDLRKSGIRKLSKQICTLRKLRYINLSHTHLTKLPKSFTSLTRLQTLDLSRCYYLKSLPKKFSNLSKLRHLDLSHCNSLCHMPFGIDRLHSLITMPLFVLGDKDSKCATLRELRTLNELRGVLVIRNLENVTEFDEARAADLKQKKLHQLGLRWSHRGYECQKVLEWLEPDPQLRVLELRGYGDYDIPFPSWMPNLRCLVKLSINDSRCSMLPKVGELPHLKELELIDLINIISIGQEFYGNGDGDGDGDVFPSLEKLKLHDIPNLNNWSNHSSSRVFRQLKRLSIQGCPELQTLPSLPSVTELVVSRSHAMILPSLTRTESLSSIVINDMDVRESFQGSSSLNSVKKLIVVHSTDLDVLKSSHIDNFTALQHLRILHCPNLEYVKFYRLGSLEKLNVVDCQILNRIDLITEDFALMELIVEDCPQLTTIDITTFSSSSLRKLVVRNCPKFSMSPHKIEELQGLEFLFITGCPKIEKRDDKKS